MDPSLHDSIPLRRSSRRRAPSIRLSYPSERAYSLAAKSLLCPPRVSKLIHSPIKPDTPPHIGAALKSPYQSHWIDCLFHAYDKMHGTGTLSLPFPESQLPSGTTVLRPRLSCEVRITDTDNYYELKIRLCADGSRMVVGIDYDLSYAPVIDGDSLLLMISVATSKGMIFYFLDISNAFQSNIIHDPRRRHYLHLPSLYMKWFRLRFPRHPLSKMTNPDSRLIMQTIRGIQGTKDAGHEWYKLLALILTKDLGMVPSTTNKGLFYWAHDSHTAYLALATDDILLTICMCGACCRSTRSHIACESAIGPCL